MISFLMMAKNVAPYIGNAIDSLQQVKEHAWELVIVDDGSTDETYSISSEYAIKDARIKVFRNPFMGKVKGTSFAYTKAAGSIIKCIDSDDVLLPEFFNFLLMHKKHDVLFHSAKIVNSDLSEITTYHPNSAWIRTDFKNVTENLISFPKWTWSFNRDVADKIFPLPENLPFEDVWMSLMCKKYAQHPWFTREPLYLYRQHGNQTFGGILNFSKEATVFRAKRLLRLMDVLEVERRFDGRSDGINFSRCRKENMFLSGQANLISTVFHPLNVKRTIRLLLIRHAPELLSKLAIKQWQREAKHLGWVPRK